MQAIILAAGRGSRLSPLTDTTPKPLVRVNGVPIIENTLDILSAHAIDRYVVVVGYMADTVQKALGDSWKGVPIVYVRNDAWDKTNNISSLWLTRHLWDRDTLLLECDVYFEKSLMDDFLAKPFRNAALVDKFQPHMDGTVVEIGPGNTITRMIPGKDQHKNFDFSDTYKTVNIYSFTRDYLQNCFLPTLELYIRMRGQQEYYELVMGALLFMGNQELTAHVCAPHRWFEIDDFTDLQRAEAHVCDQTALLAKVRSCHGGYWRFEFTDFAYLYNPYFPPVNLINELRLNLHRLLGNYPSGQAEINRALANWVKLDESLLAVGNGGAELIGSLRRRLGVTVLPVPTFAEYERGLDPGRVRRVPPDPETLRHSPAQIIREIRAGGVDSLVLVNPNNPTGASFSARELHLILEAARDLDRVILDESFADFLDDRHQASLLHELERHPNLIILRSLSKDLGVPGLRLGYLASADRELVAEIRRELPIWHVNSLAQYFLDILPKYRTEYAASRRMVIAARERMAVELDQVAAVRAIPSQGNYFCLELPRWTTSAQVQELLFSSHGLYVKDLGDKPGLRPGGFIRVAVRTPEENARLVAALSRTLGELARAVGRDAA